MISFPFRIDETDFCEQVKLLWKSDCEQFGVDYSVLEHDNIIYLENAGIRMLSPETDVEQYLSSENKYRNIVNNIEMPYELTTGALPDYMHDLIYHAFLHKTVEINDVEFVLTDYKKGDGSCDSEATISLVRAETDNIDCCC